MIYSIHDFGLVYLIPLLLYTLVPKNLVLVSNVRKFDQFLCDYSTA